MTKGIEILKCDLSNEVVQYIYGELAAARVLAFESHLLVCDECTDELAAVSHARYEVYDWKRIEFDHLATPRFVLPLDGEVEGASWIDRARAIVGRSWLVPVSAFAAVAIAIAGTYYLSEVSDVDVAEVNSPSPAVQVPAADVPPVFAVEQAASEPATNERALVKVQDQKAVKQSPVRNTKRPVPRSTQTAVQRTDTKTSAPRLNEFPEYEDTSLRLAQLFDDIDTRD